MASIPNTGATKFAWATGGAVLGALGSAGARREFVSTERARELESEGPAVLSADEIRSYGVTVPFGLAAGIALGLAKRGGSTGFTTSMHITLGALLSTAAGATINAHGEKSEDYLRGIGIMAGAVGAGSLLGVRDEFARLPMRGISLALCGIAAGMLVPTLVSGAAKLGGEIERGRTGASPANDDARPAWAR